MQAQLLVIIIRPIQAQDPHIVAEFPAILVAVGQALSDQHQTTHLIGRHLVEALIETHTNLALIQGQILTLQDIILHDTDC